MKLPTKLFAAIVGATLAGTASQAAPTNYSNGLTPQEVTGICVAKALRSDPNYQANKAGIIKERLLGGVTRMTLTADGRPAELSVTYNNSSNYTIVRINIPAKIETKVRKCFSPSR